MDLNREIQEFTLRASATGFTLPELLIVAALIGIVSAASLPTLADTIQGYRLRTTAWQIAGDLRLARQKAVSTNRRHRICFSNCGGPVPGDGYLFQREVGSGWLIDATVNPPAKGVHLTSNATITFTQAGEAAGGTVTLVSGSRTFQVRTHFTGKVTVCKDSCP